MRESFLECPSKPPEPDGDVPGRHQAAGSKLLMMALWSKAAATLEAVSPAASETILG